MAVIAMVMSMNFAACSSDDEENLDAATGLEGTWGVTHEEGYEIYNGEKTTWNDYYDPNDLRTDCTKIVISKVSDNAFTLTVHDWDVDDGKWSIDDTGNATLEGNVLTVTWKGDGTVQALKILTLTSRTLVMESTEDRSSYYSKTTFTRMQ